MPLVDLHEPRVPAEDAGKLLRIQEAAWCGRRRRCTTLLGTSRVSGVRRFSRLRSECIIGLPRGEAGERMDASTLRASFVSIALYGKLAALFRS